MSLLPDRMKTAKVVIPKKNRRNIIRYLASTSDIQLIDVQKKSFTLSTTENGPWIADTLEDFNRIIDYFGIEEKVAKRITKQVIDDDTFKKVKKKGETLNKEIIKPLSNIIDRITLAKQEIKKHQSVLEIAKNLIPFGFTFEDLSDDRPYLTVVVGKMLTKRVSRFRWNLDALTDGNFILKESEAEGNYSFLAVGFLEHYKDVINRLLANYGFEKYSIPEHIGGDPAKVIERSKTKLESLNKKIKEYEQEADTLIADNALELLAFQEQLEVEQTYLEIDNKLRISNNTVTFWGWISVKVTKDFQNEINKLTNNQAKIEITTPVFDESEYPTKTSVPRVAKIYDSLVNTYSTPGYNELNPALVIMFVYPIIFGIMFADVGHGLLFTLVGVYGLWLKNKVLDSGNIMDELKGYIRDGSILIIISGIVSMIWGFLFGTYFGLNHHVLEWVPKPLWFNPESHGELAYNPQTDRVTLMLELSLFVGMIHMTIGYVLRFITNIKKKHFLEAICVTLMLTIFHWTLFILVFTFGTDFMTWFKWDNAGTFDMALISVGGKAVQFFTINHALLPLIVLLICPVVMTGYLVTHGWDGVAELIELILSTFSNTVSYARIFAMNSVHGALSHIFLLTMFTGGEFGVLNVIGTLIGALVILALEGLFSFIQTLRLQWVEFFGKMGYQGMGNKYDPILFQRKYSKVTL
ncbi:hypothetical protein EU523_01715 [Candidatus Heimdallarchaeota archaeon]|nr:MAG: hypothetical protein EU523_01715 [Candidatus Heimdallarchaeota archaeon]